MNKNYIILGLLFSLILISGCNEQKNILYSNDNHYVTLLENLNADLINKSLYNPYYNNCTKWEEKHFTESMYEVSGIDCPTIIQESYKGEYDYNCTVCTEWSVLKDE